MKIVIDSWKNDIKSILDSTFIRVTILIFCLIPSVYSLSMIKASWDPYSVNNTKRLPIAIVNNDEGAVSSNKEINIGNSIVNKLKQNKKIDWQFVSDWQGNEGLNNGKYYSLIEIPNDFSTKILSLKTDTPQRAQIVYQVNEKLNAAATKISSQVEGELMEQIRQNLIKIGSKRIIKKMNNLGNSLEIIEPKLINTNKSLKQIDQYMDLELNNLNNSKLDLSNNNSELVQFNQSISNLGNATTTVQDTINQNCKELSNSLQMVKEILNDSPSISDSFNLNDPLTSNNQEILLNNNKLITNLNKSINSMNYVNKLAPNKLFSNSIVFFKNEINLLENENKYLQGSLIKGKTTVDLTRLNSINKLSLQISFIQNQISSNKKIYNSILSNYKDDINNFPKYDLSDSIQKNSSNEILVNKQISKVENKISSTKSKLNRLQNITEKINKKNLRLAINVLSVTPKTANTFASPVHLKQKNLYNLGLLGYSVTPFYTSLSIWIGILLLTTIVSWDFTLYNNFFDKKMSMIQKYISKLLVFLSLGLVQTIIMVLGEILILRISPESLVAFILTVYISSLVFTIIIFSLVYTFGNLGKIFSILLMLIQIFGTGGIYPTEIIPSNLSSLSKYLPFYYSIKSIRYSLVGLINIDFYQNLLILFDFIIIFILITPFRKFLYPTVEKLENGFKKSYL